MRGHSDRCGVVFSPELREQGAEHRQMRTPGRRRRLGAPAPAAALQVPAVGGDRIRGHVLDKRGAAELVAQRIGKPGVDRAVLPRRRLRDGTHPQALGAGDAQSRGQPIYRGEGLEGPLLRTVLGR